MTNATESNNTAITLGNELRRQRELKKLSIGEVSERLKLPARQIEALENGTYETLPEPVFVRGFLRSYGRFLELDEAILNDALEHISPPSKTKKVSGSSDFNFANKPQKKPFPSWIFGIVAVAAIGYGISIWQGKSQEEHIKQEQNSSVMPTNTTNNAITPPTLNNANVIVKPMTASDMQTETASSTNATTASNVQAASSVGLNNTGELLIVPRYRTMLTVTNAKGEVLINKIVAAHSENRFTDGAPFEVRLGYAIGAQVTFSGSEFDVNAARKGGKTAVFTVQ